MAKIYWLVYSEQSCWGVCTDVEKGWWQSFPFSTFHISSWLRFLFFTFVRVAFIAFTWYFRNLFWAHVRDNFVRNSWILTTSSVKTVVETLNVFNNILIIILFLSGDGFDLRILIFALLSIAYSIISVLNLRISFQISSQIHFLSWVW